MKRIGLHVISAVAAAPLFCAGPGLIPPANAQTIGSSYTSTAPWDCRVISAGNGVLVVSVSEDHAPGGRTTVDLSMASSKVSASVPFGSRRRMSVRRPSSSNMVKPWTKDQARAMAAACSSDSASS
jgi:hypothetical protein